MQLIFVFFVFPSGLEGKTNHVPPVELPVAQVIPLPACDSDVPTPPSIARTPRFQYRSIFSAAKSGFQSLQCFSSSPRFSKAALPGILCGSEVLSGLSSHIGSSPEEHTNLAPTRSAQQTCQSKACVRPVHKATSLLVHCSAGVIHLDVLFLFISFHHIF
jgi:hypothetical protein